MGIFRRFTSRSFKYATAMVFTLSLYAGVAGSMQPARAEGPADPAPFIAAKVVNENAGKKVLFDNTHGQTAGAADWVIDGGFSDFGQALASNGYDVHELRQSTPITYNDLKNYDVFVTAEPNIPFKQSEQAAMEQYVKAGNSIFFIGDHYNADRNKNRWDGSESINGYRRGAWEDPAKGMSAEEKSSAAMQGVVSSDWLGSQFGVRFRYNALGDITANQIVEPAQAFGITAGVSNVAMHAGSTLAIIDPAKAKGIVYLPKTNQAWGNAVDQGVYNGGGIPEGPYAAVSKVGLGKAAFMGDSSPVEDATPKYLREETGTKKTTYDGFKEQDDAVLLVNIVDWLSKKEEYTSLTEVKSLQLDQPTALLPFEGPQTSTEPQAEPWSAPAAGYKWWDQRTFKAGSYGGSTASAQPVYSIVRQEQLPNAQPFQIRVTADQLAPNSTISGFSTGIYVAGGNQVAQIQNPDGSWPTSYGYSGTFSLESNGKGHAYKDLTVRIKPGTSGSANLRLRQNGSNLLTQSVVLADVPAQPLPEEGNTVPARISVAEARNLPAGKVVTLEGVVTTEPGAFGGQAFYMQDESGGIYVYQNQSGFHQGDRVKLTASLALYNSELELTDPVAIEKTGEGQLPEAVQVTELSDANQGQLVELPTAMIRNVIDATPVGSFEFDAVSGEVSHHVRVDARTGLTWTSFPYQEGQQVKLKGISAIFKGNYQLKPRGLDDFSAQAGAALQEVELSLDQTTLNIGDTAATHLKGTLTDGSEAELSRASVQYISSHETVSLDTYGELKALKEGSAEITASVTLDGKTVVSNPVTVRVDKTAVGEVPGKPVLSHDNGQDTGLKDGNYNITMNLWWGTNGDELKLYENDKLIGTQSLQAASPGAQHAVIPVTGKTNGTYTYTAELINASGKTTSDSLTVEVTDASPGIPVLSHDNWDGDGTYTLTMNMWWGTNATKYNLYENGELIDAQDLPSQNPQAQSAVTNIQNQKSGTYEYRAELVNASGEVSSQTISVEVKGH
ncbi:endonuclease [Paenibacillus sp. UKAQ_18]|nr:endonuclease [Paenibacillus sp. UKAQ_18]